MPGVATSHSQRRGWPLSGVGSRCPASRQATPSEGGGRCRASEAGTRRRDRPLPAKGVAAVGRRKQVPGVATSRSQRRGWPLSGVGSKPLPAKGVAAVGRRKQVPGVATSHSQRRGWPLSGVGSRCPASRQATPSEGVAAVGRRKQVPGVATSHSQRRGWPLSGVGSRYPASRQATPSEGGGRCRASEAGTRRRDKPLPAKGVAAVGRRKQVPGVATSHSQRRGWPLSGVGSRYPASRQATPSEGGGRCRASEAGTRRRDKPLPAKGVAAVGRRKQVPGVATSHSQRRGWPVSGVNVSSATWATEWSFLVRDSNIQPIDRVQVQLMSPSQWRVPPS